MASSFKKKVTNKPSHPRGSRPSLYNAQLLVSSGVPSMDSLLGGGLAVGTVLLLEEDVAGSYSRLLFKYFLSEGVMCGHTLFLASANEKTQDILKDLPGSVDDARNSPQAFQKGREQPSTKKDEVEPSEEDPMKIAWRYQSLPKVQSSFSNRFGHSFDLTARMSETRTEAVDTVHFNALGKTGMSSAQELYIALKEEIEEVIQRNHFSVDEAISKQRNVLRLGLQSLGSPLWLDQGGMTDSSHSLLQFFHCLRALLRRAYAVALVTVPTHLMQDSLHINRLRRLCDGAVRLESFAGSDKETNPAFRDYHGLFHIHKLPCLNSLTSYHPETLDLAFKLKRKKFSIEKLHLPPELSETANRAQQDPVTIPKPKSTKNDGSTSKDAEGTRRKLTKRDIDF